MPQLYNSTDIRPLNMKDFKTAHEQVWETENIDTIVYNIWDWMDMCRVVGVCECVDWFIEHERASAVERAIWRRRFKEEDVTQLLHVKIKQSGGMEVVFCFSLYPYWKNSRWSFKREKNPLEWSKNVLFARETSDVQSIITCLMVLNDVLWTTMYIEKV